MANITLDGLPAKAGTVDNAGLVLLRESGVDKKLTISDLLTKISSQHQSFMNTFLGTADKAAARAALDIDRRVTVNNANYTILATDKVVAQIGTMSAARTFSLPAASTFPAGGELIIIDESGSVDSTNKIIVQRNGTDTIDGATSEDVDVAYGFLRLICNGSNSWNKVVLSNIGLTGEIKTWASSSVPSGYLECNGAEVAISNYGNLSTAIYVGDSNNADTDLVFGYKTNGSGTRSTSGTHIKLPDLRGEFIRGWDNSRGIDGSRKFGSYQAWAIENITGSIQTVRWSSTETGAFSSSSGGGGNGTGTISTTTQNINFDASNVVNTASETRPRNISLMFIIKT